LTEKRQLDEIKKWAFNYREWNKTDRNENDIKWRIDNSEKLQRLLSPSKINSLTQNEIKEVLSSLNCLTSYPINRTKILNNNKLDNIKKALDNLVNGKEELAERMNKCNSIKNLGTSSMNEILGFTNPDIYPLINKNSNSGLRFFGYQIRAYS